MASSSSSSLYDRVLEAIPFLSRLQDWVIALGQRKSAVRWLLGLSFLESIIFPIPIDPLLAGIVMARPRAYMRLAVMTGVASTLGGIAGWGIGVWLGEAVMASGWIGSEGAYIEVKEHFARHGWVLVLIGAFTPIPYKVMVVSAGFLGIGFIPLVGASLIGRTARFVLVAGIVRHRQDNKIAGVLTLLLVVLVLVFWWMTHV